jgi:hypothetical protein
LNTHHRSRSVIDSAMCFSGAVRFSPASVQFKSEIKDASPRKRHQKRHLDYCTEHLLNRMSQVRVLPGAHDLTHAKGLSKIILHPNSLRSCVNQAESQIPKGARFLLFSVAYTTTNNRLTLCSRNKRSLNFGIEKDASLEFSFHGYRSALLTRISSSAATHLPAALSVKGVARLELEDNSRGWLRGVRR